MKPYTPPNRSPDRPNSAARKVQQALERPLALLSDGCADWVAAYLRLTIQGVRSEAVTQKIALHLQRFQTFFLQSYGHGQLSACVRRDVVAWQRTLQAQGLAPATINNHLASLSGFTTWVHTQNPTLFPVGDPAKGIGELSLGPLEPRALDEDQVRSLKNLCDRLDRFYQYTGRALAHRQIAHLTRNTTATAPTPARHTTDASGPPIPPRTAPPPRHRPRSTPKSAPRSFKGVPQPH